MQKLSKKGFTLIELLAVIVILAVIILIAMPNVLGSMEKARMNAFATEANSIIKYAGTAYSDLSMSNSLPSGGTVCMDVKMLGSQTGAKNYLSKDLSSYTGTVTIKVDSGTGNVTYTSSFSNGTYSVSNYIGNEVDSGDVKTESITATCAANLKPTGW